MSFQIPKIYPLTDSRLAGLSHVEQVSRLIDGGASFIQLREKTGSPARFFLDVRESIDVARRTGAKIIVNDRVDIALAAKADGVHLGQNDLPPIEARRLLGEHAIIGLSTHNQAQLKEAISLPVDYIAYGPIFPTATKDDPDPVVGLDTLIQVRKIAGDKHLVAIGGINSENLRLTIESGADSVALISELYKYRDRIAEHFAALTEIANKVK
ncbi:MAG: thiamine phosphate synthase [Pyrinomonadaceae bacterium]|nr:thiamine phosphate synthase [Pyrinomonadaceae bacterium]